MYRHCVAKIVSSKFSMPGAKAGRATMRLYRPKAELATKMLERHISIDILNKITILSVLHKKSEELSTHRKYFAKFASHRNGL